jgi:hypothetical protein
MPHSTTPVKNLTPLTEAPDRPWLEHFAPERRSGVANLFHQVHRAGAATPPLILHDVRQGVRRRLQSQYCSPDRAAHLALVLEALDCAHDAALAYAEEVIAWNRLPQPERDTIKAERRREYQQTHMRAQPPTSKQISFLRALGDLGPDPANRAAASALIDALLKRKVQP